MTSIAIELRTFGQIARLLGAGHITRSQANTLLCALVEELDNLDSDIG